ncbi:MAG: type III pantothenate kinase [Balneolaceae bacterium]
MYYKLMSNFDSINPENILFLDVGNTAIKGAFRREANWQALHDGELKTASDLIRWIEKHPAEFTGFVLSSVRKEVTEAIRHELNPLLVKALEVSDIPADFLDYESPETLGIDRFLACFGAVSHTKEAVVVIDAGTATTIDFISTEEVFCGGLIVPGFSAFMDILHQKAPALPVVETELPEKWPGKSTIDSLKWGQAGFYKHGIEQTLKKFEEEFGNFDLFLTGGDAVKVEALLEREGKIRPFLVFDGMERLLNIEH